MKRIRIALAIVACSIIFTGAISFAQKADYPAPPPYVAHPSGRLPLMASYAFMPPLINQQQMEWVKEAGFNTIGQNLPVKDVDSLLSLASRNGVALRTSVYGFQDSVKMRMIVDRYRDQPFFWAYCGQDEPSAGEFGKVAALQRQFLRLDPPQMLSLNLLPAVGAKQLGAPDYRTYVEEFVKTVNPAFIMFDIYPVKRDKKGNIYVDDCLYRSLDVISDVSKESDRPFWQYVLCTQHWNYPKATREYLRFQVFTSLSYGAQGIAYFTYSMPDFDKGKGEFSNAPIDWDGNRTDVWYMVRDVNREVRNLEQVFLGAEVVEVSHTGKKIPEGTRRLKTLPAPFRMIETNGEGVQVSHLKNGGKDYLVVINRDVTHSQNVRLSRSRPVMRLYGDGKRKKDSGPNFKLGPGGYAIFEF